MHPYNPNIADRDLKYYIFDWDDNILRMPTHIHMERLQDDGTWKPHPVPTHIFSIVRQDSEHYRLPPGDPELAFVEFRDFATDDESKFLKDARIAIDKQLASTDQPPPSFNTFRKTLIEGRIFAIITARGHHSHTLRKGVELFIERILTDAEREEMMYNLRGYIVCYEGSEVNNAMSDEAVLEQYLSLNHYHPVTGPEFLSVIQNNRPLPSPEKSEVRKQVAILDFLDHLFKIIHRIDAQKPISVGFSDDDRQNVNSVMDFIRRELSAQYPSVKFVVYDTSDPTLEKGRKVIVSGQLSLGI